MCRFIRDVCDALCGGRHQEDPSMDDVALFGGAHVTKLFEEVRARLPNYCERLPTACMLAKDADGLVQVTVELSFNVVGCYTLNGAYIHFALEPEENRSTSSHAQTNAFSVMMTSTRKLKLPPKLLPAEKHEAGK